jgi:hypothetical protein
MPQPRAIWAPVSKDEQESGDRLAELRGAGRPPWPGGSSPRAARAAGQSHGSQVIVTVPGLHGW